MKSRELKKQIRGAARSWTIWFNGLLLAMLPFATDILILLPQLLPEVKPYMPANAYEFMGKVVVIGNILLRFRTKSSLSSKTEKPYEP